LWYIQFNKELHIEVSPEVWRMGVTNKRVNVSM
jgi:hypothetical protein